MSFDNDFDISRPIDHTLIADLPGWHRNTKVQVKALLAKEHIEPDVGGYGGQHVKGSARAFLQSTEPTTRPDGDAITTAASTAAVKDDGRLAVLTGIKTGYNVLRVYAATSAGVSTGWSNLHVASVDKAFSVELTGDDNIEIENNKAILWRKHNEPATTISAIKVNTSNEVEILHALTVDSGLTVAGAVQVGGKITGVTDPTEDQDAATKAYVDGKIDAMLVVAHDYTLKCGSSGDYTTTLSTRSVSVTSGKQYLILVSGSTSTSNHKPRIALFVDGELKADIEIGAYDNHNHTGKGFFLQNIYTATSTGSINVQIKADAAVTLRSAQVLVIQIK